MLEPISANQTHANYRLQPLSQRRLSAPPAFTCHRPLHRLLPAHCIGCCQRRFSHHLPHHPATVRHTGGRLPVATAIVPQQSAPPALLHDRRHVYLVAGIGNAFLRKFGQAANDRRQRRCWNTHEHHVLAQIGCRTAPITTECDVRLLLKPRI